MPTEDEFKMIDQEEVRRKLEEGAQLVNVLEPEYYSEGVIPGSLKIPTSQLRDRVSDLDKNREVITYCLGKECKGSKAAAEILAEEGFRVSVYSGGITEWKADHLPVEGWTDSDESRRELTEGAVDDDQGKVKPLRKGTRSKESRSRAV